MYRLFERPITKILAIMPMLLSGPLFAQTNENWNAVNLLITDDYVIPAYEYLALKAGELESSAQELCAIEERGEGADGFAQQLSEVKSKYHGVMDAWQEIQHIQFGPVTYFNWNFRMQYWPDEKGTGSRQLQALVAGQDIEALESENFGRTSVGVQGLPALENLLFSENSELELQEAYRCQVLATISRNISEISTGIHQRWRDEFRTTVANADERGFFESAEDATIDFLKALVEPVRRIQEQKVNEVIGDSPEAVRVRRAESWRSGRSLRNIRLNVAALNSLFIGSEGEAERQENALSTVLLEKDVTIINRLFSELEDKLAALPDDYASALAADEGHAEILKVAENLDALFEAMEAALKNTDLYLGFNSLDGD